MARGNYLFKQLNKMGNKNQSLPNPQTASEFMDSARRKNPEDEHNDYMTIVDAENYGRMKSQEDNSELTDNCNDLKEKLKKIASLYYNYNRISIQDIQQRLGDVKIVKKEHKGIGSTFGYYPLNKTAMDKIINKPRNTSLTFDATTTENTPMEGLKEKKTINYLVKSSSRFFLKPDIGEIMDQFETHDLFDSKLKAICFNEGHYLLDGTDGEHFIMTATLLIQE